MWTKERRIAAGILLGLAFIMLFPLAKNAIDGNVGMVQNLGFADGTRAPLHAWIAAFAFALAYIAYTFRMVPLVRMHQREISLFKMVGVVAAFASGIMEEVVFRRWLMDSALALGLGDFGQIIVSGVVFGVFHLAWGAFSASRRIVVYGAISTVVAGMALAAIYLLGGRNLGPCIAAHVMINLVLEPWLVLNAVSGAMSPRDKAAGAQPRI